jgi:Ca2+-binding RTX toxin-like protein
MRRTLITAAVAAAAVIALPPMAQGATLHQDGRHRVLLQDTAGDANLVTVTGSKRVLIEDLNAPIEVDGVGACMPVGAYAVSCAPSVRAIDVDLGAGADVATIDSTKPIEVEGGHGRDRFNAGLTDGPSRIRWIGGVGLDTISYGLAATGVDVAVDDEEDDGRPGDHDQVFDDVEVIVGSQFDDMLSGDRWTLQLAGLGGDDMITGGPGAQELLGGEGSDRIFARDGAADTIDCGGAPFADVAVVDLMEASISRCATVDSGS